MSEENNGQEKRRNHLSEAGRQRIVEALHRRWARWHAEHDTPPAPQLPSLHDLYEAAAQLMPYAALKEIVVKELTTEEIVNAIAHFEDDGASKVRDALRKVIVEKVGYSIVPEAGKEGE